MFPPPPFDPDVAHALATRDDIVTSMTPDEIVPLRATIVRAADAELTAHGAFDLTVHETDGPDGRRLGVVVLTPRDRTSAVPVLYHVHGGGLVVGTPYDDLPALARLAAEVGCAVASVDYRLAPEHPYPAAVEDAYAGLVWLAGAAEDLGLDADRIVLSGVSAGGGIAAATALLARDRGGPHVIGQLLACPMLDDRNASESGRQMAGLGAWDRTANETGWSAYLGADRTEVPVYAAPGRAEDLSGLPPMFLDVGSAETFRDEVLAYAALAWRCGVAAELHVWAGGAHGFDALVPDAPLTHQAIAARIGWLRRLLGAHAADATAASPASALSSR